MVSGLHPLPRGPGAERSQTARTARGPCPSRTLPHAPPPRPSPRRSDRSRRPGRVARHIPLGTIRRLSEAGGLYMVCVMPRGPNTSRLASLSSGSPDTFSSTRPRKSALRSLYSALSPGHADQGLRVEQIDGPRPAPARLQVKGDVALEAARVVEQHAHGDLVLGTAGESGQIPAHRRLEVELSLIHQSEGRGGGAHDLGDRGNVPEGGVRAAAPATMGSR